MAKLKTDWVLFLTILAIVGFGLVMLYSASSAVAELRYNVEPWVRAGTATVRIRGHAVAE